MGVFEAQLAEFVFRDSQFFTNSSYSDDSYDYLFANSLDFIEYRASSERTVRVMLDSSEGFGEDAKAKLVGLLDEYPKCEYRDGSLVVKMLPFGFFKECTEREKESIAADVFAYAESREGGMQVMFSDMGELLRRIGSPVQSAGSKFGAQRQVMENVRSFISGLPSNGDWRDVSGETQSGAVSSRHQISRLTFGNVSGLYLAMPFLTHCTYDSLKIIAWFMNDTGVSFLNDYAIDLDLTCYIDDEVERSYRVGYGSGFKGTRFIEWGGDATGGGHESLQVKVNEYIKEKLANRGMNTHMRIRLGLCWHETSEVRSNSVHVTLAWGRVVEQVPITFIPDAKRECSHTSLLIDVDMETGILKYEKPRLYPVVKVYYKGKLVGTDEGTPDVKVGFACLTKDEFNGWCGRNPAWRKAWYHSNTVEEGSPESWVKFYVYAHKDVRLNEGYECASFLMAEPIDEAASFDSLYDVITDVLGRHIGSRGTYLNLRTKERLGRRTYEAVRCDDIYFGWNVQNTDRETGFNMVYYGYIRPDCFRGGEIREWVSRPIDAALPDMDMQYRSAYLNYITSGELASLKVEMLRQFDDLREGDSQRTDDYVSEVGAPLASVTGFRGWAMGEPDLSGRLKELE